MAGETPLKSSSTQSFTSPVAAVYIFNLIVGTGALALPSAFATGWSSATLLLIMLAILSYITATWVVESMAACNAIIHIEKSITSHKIEDDGENEEAKDSNYFEEPDESDRTYLVRNDLTGQVSLASYGAVASLQDQSDVFHLKHQLELAKMSEMLYNRWGRLAFKFCLILYLFGDLAIYITAISKSLRDVTCSSASSGSDNVTTNNNHSSKQDINSCSNLQHLNLTMKQVYQIYVAVLILVLGPFAYFNVSKTKYLQIFTSCMRWTAFITMITLSILRIADPNIEHGNPPVLNISTAPMVFGVSVYAFMCHHSLPSLITPIENKTKVSSILAADYILIATFYLLLSFTGIFAFASVPDLYTLAFKPDGQGSNNIAIEIADYFLALFPVFTLSTNFPIIAITLRNNLEAIMTESSTMIANLSPLTKRLIFPTVAVLPPVVVALLTEDLGILVSITGAYAGAGIQYIIPCSLVFLARKKLVQYEEELNLTLQNPLESFFKHKGFIVTVVVWSLLAVGLVTTNFILKAIK